MKYLVFGVRQDNQVFRRVINFVTINMMNMVKLCKWSSNYFSGYLSVLSNSFTISNSNNIARVDRTLAIGCLKSFIRTSMSSVSLIMLATKSFRAVIRIAVWNRAYRRVVHYINRWEINAFKFVLSINVKTTNSISAASWAITSWVATFIRKSMGFTQAIFNAAEYNLALRGTTFSRYWEAFSHKPIVTFSLERVK